MSAVPPRDLTLTDRSGSRRARRVVNSSAGTWRAPGTSMPARPTTWRRSIDRW